MDLNPEAAFRQAHGSIRSTRVRERLVAQGVIVITPRSTLRVLNLTFTIWISGQTWLIVAQPEDCGAPRLAHESPKR